MLQSIRNILGGIDLSKTATICHELSTCEMLKNHLLSHHFIPPTIMALKFNNFPSDPSDMNVHVMVATGITIKNIEGSNEYFVQCKNSYRNDVSIPGLDSQKNHK